MDAENKKKKTTKSLQQKIASAQLRLNRLQHKSKTEAKQIETKLADIWEIGSEKITVHMEGGESVGNE